ncbi:hypothetical protein CRG98_015605 [Punica granatum]|uniref:Uncharacterized protein n=1 Tax=Punica granatum TaxID=22663 RepID=A0A2I0K612_PUNGR|nr:hypothetical protein CRG98_015605 [Punica granatum]
MHFPSMLTPSRSIIPDDSCSLFICRASCPFHCAIANPKGCSPLKDSCLPRATGRALDTPGAVGGCATLPKPTIFKEGQTIEHHHQSPRMRQSRPARQASCIPQRFAQIPSLNSCFGSIPVIRVHPGHSGPSRLVGFIPAIRVHPGHSGPSGHSGSSGLNSGHSGPSGRSGPSGLNSDHSGPSGLNFGHSSPSGLNSGHSGPSDLNSGHSGSIRSKLRSFGSARSKFRSFGSIWSKFRSFGSIPVSFGYIPGYSGLSRSLSGLSRFKFPFRVHPGPKVLHNIPMCPSKKPALWHYSSPNHQSIERCPMWDSKNPSWCQSDQSHVREHFEGILLEPGHPRTLIDALSDRAPEGPGP